MLISDSFRARLYILTSSIVALISFTGRPPLCAFCLVAIYTDSLEDERLPEIAVVELSKIPLK
jgi:hypothetical protein